MSDKRRLLILSCSQRKRLSHESLPAIHRYDGPLFHVLRRFLREATTQTRNLDIYILSAAFGLIPGDFPLPYYDQKMNATRAVELQPQVMKVFLELQQSNNYTSTLFVLGKTYLKAFASGQDLMAHRTELRVADGPIGKKQAQLKKWLWSNSA